MIEWVQKSKPKKYIRRASKPPPPPCTTTKNLPPYFIRRTTQPGYVGTTVYQESSDCFEYPKKSLLKSSHQKWYLQNFPSQKNPGIENFKPQQNPSIIPTTWNPEYPLGHKNRHQISHTSPWFSYMMVFMITICWRINTVFALWSLASFSWCVAYLNVNNLMRNLILVIL